jgi:segregation and condensation protein B
MDQTLINRIVEAALLASSQPLTVAQLSALFTLDEPAPEGSIQAALEALQADCATRGVELVEVASGWRYQVRADVHPWVARLWTERHTRYTRATLETLALIAYRQPITRGEIEQVRGVATNSNIIKALEEREWIRVVGHRDMPGRPELLGTTKAFLDYFGLKRLDELPPLSELKDFGELEPQLQFDGERALGGIADPAQTDAAADVAANDGEAAQDDADEAGLRQEPADINADAADEAPAQASSAERETDAGQGPSHGQDHAPATDADDGDGDAAKARGPEREQQGDGLPTQDHPHHHDGADAAAEPNDALADDGDSTRSRHD